MGRGGDGGNETRRGNSTVVPYKLELIIIRVLNECRALCKPLSGFFSHHADHPNEPPFNDEEGRACLYRSRRQASLPAV